MATWHQWLANALQQRWTSIYARGVALVLVYGATVHVSNILGFSGTPWLQTPLLWRCLDVILLGFDSVTAIGLWTGSVWSVGALGIGLLTLQFLPYTVWRSQFVVTPDDASTLNGLLGTEALILVGFGILMGLKK